MRLVFLFAAFALVVAALVLFPLFACAQFVQLAPAPQPTPLQWFTWTNCPGEAFLYQGDKQLGSLHIASGVYRELVTPGSYNPYTQRIENSVWSPPIDPPIDPPAAYARNFHRRGVQGGDGVKNFGVDLSRQRPHGAPGQASYEITDERGSRQVSRDEALLAAQDKLEDDSGKLRLTFLGPKESTDAALQAYMQAPEMADVRMKINARGYVAGDPVIQSRGKFESLGAVTCYLQQADGTVLYKAAYSGPGDFRAIRASVDGKPILPLNGTGIPDLVWPAGLGVGLVGWIAWMKRHAFVKLAKTPAAV